MPSLLAYTEMNEKAMKQLQVRIADFLKWLSKKADQYYSKDGYGKTSKEYQDKVPCSSLCFYISPSLSLPTCRFDPHSLIMLPCIPQVKQATTVKAK